MLACFSVKRQSRKARDVDCRGDRKHDEDCFGGGCRFGDGHDEPVLRGPKKGTYREGSGGDEKGLENWFTLLLSKREREGVREYKDSIIAHMIDRLTRTSNNVVN